MRNPRRTFRKPSQKQLSKNKLRRYQGYDTLDEELFEAELALQVWFTDYMANLHSEAGMKRNEADLAELTTLSWLVSAAPPAKAQYFGGVNDGVTAFYCDPMKGTPLTHSEANRVKYELEQAFSQRHEQYEVVYLGDVAKL